MCVLIRRHSVRLSGSDDDSGCHGWPRWRRQPDPVPIRWCLRGGQNVSRANNANRHQYGDEWCCQHDAGQVQQRTQKARAIVMMRMLMITCRVVSICRHAHAGHGHVHIGMDGSRSDLKSGQAFQSAPGHFIQARQAL